MAQAIVCNATIAEVGYENHLVANGAPASSKPIACDHLLIVFIKEGQRGAFR